MYNHAPVGYNCPFCNIVNGKKDDHLETRENDVVYKDDLVTAFVAAQWWPNNKGHVIIVPNEHFENIYEIVDQYNHRIADISKKIAIALKEVYKCDGVSTRQHNEPAGSQDIWHYHMHVYPRYNGDNLYKTEPAGGWVSKEERVEYADRLKEYFKKNGK